MSDLSPAESKEISAKLKNLSPGYIPYDLFVEFSRLKVTPILEIIPLCQAPDGRVNVVFLKRPSDDRWWPDCYHTPGTCLLANEISVSDQWGLPTQAFNRLKNTELKGIKTIGQPVFVGYLTRHLSRGPESVAVFYQEVDYQTALPYLFPVDSFPPKVIEGQLDMIHRCVQAFTKELK